MGQEPGGIWVEVRTTVTVVRVGRGRGRGLAGSGIGPRLVPVVACGVLVMGTEVYVGTEYW